MPHHAYNYRSAPRRSPAVKYLVRLAALILAIAIALFAFYLSLLASAEPLSYDERAEVSEAVALIDARGFASESFVLRRLAAFRSNDNWLNASVEKENAYAATNFPFEIVTLYPDFFTYPRDAVERAAILLHEARHLRGDGEAEAYEFVWRNRKRLGWTREGYESSTIWQSVRRQTRDYNPKLFVCEFNDFGDCTN